MSYRYRHRPYRSHYRHRRWRRKPSTTRRVLRGAKRVGKAGYTVAKFGARFVKLFVREGIRAARRR